MCGDGKKVEKKKITREKKIQDGGIHKSKQVQTKKRSGGGFLQLILLRIYNLPQNIRVTAPFRNSQPGLIGND